MTKGNPMNKPSPEILQPLLIRDDLQKQLARELPEIAMLYYTSQKKDPMTDPPDFEERFPILTKLFLSAIENNQLQQHSTLSLIHLFGIIKRKPK